MNPCRRVPILAAVLACWAAGSSAQDRFPVQRLTFDPAQEGFPSWSPDGRTLVYSYLDRRDSGIVAGLHTVPAVGGPPHWLTDEIGEHPSWSREGHYIVFDAAMGTSVQLVSAQGGSPVRVVPASVPIASGGNPIWSPDGSRIAFKSGMDLWVLEVGTGDARMVVTREGMQAIPGCWSPDGDALYFLLREADSPRSSIWATVVDGADSLEILPPGEHTYRYMDLSPDGALLAFVQCEERNCDLWVMPAMGGPAVQLTKHPAYDDTPRWSPDGTRIAFTSTRAENFDVWVMTVDLTALRAALDSAKARP